jgi:predicted Zn-dependent protease
VEKFFATHPLTEDRIANVERQIAGMPRQAGLSRTDGGFRELQSRVSRYAR